MKLRPATPDDAPDLARLINLASDDIPTFLWQQIAEQGQTAADVGEARARRADGDFSYRNAVVVECQGQVAAMMLGYLQENPYHIGDLTDYPSIVRPLVELEAQAPGSWYVNALAVYPDFQRRGIASMLLTEAEHRAAEHNSEILSLIVAQQNLGASALYHAFGYRQRASKPVIPYPGMELTGDWLLMVKTRHD